MYSYQGCQANLSTCQNQPDLERLASWVGFWDFFLQLVELGSGDKIHKSI